MIRKPSSPPHLLSIGIGLALLGAGPVNAQQVVADGNTQVPEAGEYVTSSSIAPGDTAGYVFYALNGGQITPTGRVLLRSSGAGAAGVRAEGAGSAVRLIDADIQTTGDGASGVSVAQGGYVQLSGPSSLIATQGSYAHAAEVSEQAQLQINNAVLYTSGLESHGVLSLSDSVARISDTIILTSGMYSSGVQAEGGRLELSNLNVETSGEMATALKLSGTNGGPSSIADVQGGQFITRGSGASAVNVQANATLNMRGSSVATAGDYANGVVMGGGLATLTDTSIRTYGEAASGVDIIGGEFKMAGGSILATGEGSTGVHLHGMGSSAWIDGTKVVAQNYGFNVNNEEQQLFINNADITSGKSAIWVPKDSAVSVKNSVMRTTGDQAHGIDNQSGQVDISSTDIYTTGDDSYGLYVSDDQRMLPKIEGRAVDIGTAGDRSIGVVSRLGATVHLDSGHILTLGENAHGLLAGGAGEMLVGDLHVRTEGSGAYAALINDNGMLAVNGGSLISANHGALWIRSARSFTASNGAILSGGNGVLASVDAALPASLTLKFDGDVQAQGDINITAEDVEKGTPVSADIHLDLSKNSHWMGATEILNSLNVSANSQWTLTGDSTVQSLSLSESTLMLSSADDTTFNTLTINGDFNTEASRINFRGELAGDETKIDQLHILGDTNGQAGVRVLSLGGAGAQTELGISLIKVDGASNAQYSLVGRAVAGSYEYFLHKGQDGGWYLQSTLDPCIANPSGLECRVIQPPVDFCEVNPEDSRCKPIIDPIIDPPQPPPPPPPSKVVLRPEIGAYLANQLAAAQMLNHRADDRASRGGRGAWVHARQGSDDLQAIDDQIEMHLERSALHVGTDLLKWGENLGGSVGVMAASGNATSRANSKLTGYGARGRVKGYGLGIYGTWTQRAQMGSGAYVDGWVQYGNYRSSVQGDALDTHRYDARTVTASVESGYAFALGSSANSAMFLQPQVQVNYRSYSSPRTTENNGTVIHGADASGVSGRIGMRLFGHSQNGKNQVEPFIAVNWLRDYGHNALNFDGNRVGGGVSPDRVEIKAGATLRLGCRWSAGGELAVENGSNGYRSTAVQTVLRRSW